MAAVADHSKKRKATESPLSPLEQAKKEKLAPTSYVNLTTHNVFDVSPLAVRWGEADPRRRGPIIATNRHEAYRNSIGAHSGSYCIYRALAVTVGALDKDYYPQYSMTRPPFVVPPNPAWGDPKKIVTMDPFGHDIVGAFEPYLKRGYDVRPTIAVTKAHEPPNSSKE